MQTTNFVGLAKLHPVLKDLGLEADAVQERNPTIPQNYPNPLTNRQVMSLSVRLVRLAARERRLRNTFEKSAALRSLFTFYICGSHYSELCHPRRLPPGEPWTATPSAQTAFRKNDPQDVGDIWRTATYLEELLQVKIAFELIVRKKIPSHIALMMRKALVLTNVFPELDLEVRVTNVFPELDLEVGGRGRGGGGGGASAAGRGGGGGGAAAAAAASGASAAGRGGGRGRGNNTAGKQPQTKKEAAAPSTPTLKTNTQQQTHTGNGETAAPVK
ncbi:unnamed protein product [Vitrella brassicaformis CCMP3155]|uniref:Uncharacterized protein n=1 Tax=Vitrella brassicaformis (strain CCMP3155) TaxID=1169540 RepID=A0A0G4GX59_VITBC|nr:unnamed protein product [Vitrella brassicaformis CCMP3155]|eukprot:CEM35613.1 unnamed protein product [Vitrella brassicaformis CCMP3155]